MIKTKLVYAHSNDFSIVTNNNTFIKIVKEVPRTSHVVHLHIQRIRNLIKSPSSGQLFGTFPGRRDFQSQEPALPVIY